MSGTLSTVLGAFDRARQLVSLFSGGPIVLGDFEFSSYEVPERVSFGGQQQITTHKLIGGARVLDAMGFDPGPVTWSGILLGPDTHARRTQLLQLVRARKAVDLSWADISFLVMVSECTFEDGYQQTSYRISCIVIPDTRATDAVGNGATPETSVGAFDVGGLHLTGVVQALAPGLLPAASSLATTAQQAGQVLNAWTNGTAANVSLSGTVSSLTSALSSGMSGASKLLSLSAQFGAGDVQSVTNAAGILATGQAAIGFAKQAQTVLGRL